MVSELMIQMPGYDSLEEFQKGMFEPFTQEEECGNDGSCDTSLPD